MRQLIYVALVSLFLSFSWLGRILVSKSMRRRVENRFEENG